MASSRQHKHSRKHLDSSSLIPRKLSLSEDIDDDDDDEKDESKTLQSVMKSLNKRSASRTNKPAELFRKDLISAMKLPDTDHLDPDSYWVIFDAWKQEWEKGVQVPVSPANLSEPNVVTLRSPTKQDFKLPKKYIRISHDDFFSKDLHFLSDKAAAAEKVCRYDLDTLDTQWLSSLNKDRKILGLDAIQELTMEHIIEDLETQCFDNLQKAIRAKEGLGIEYDENVICDVCQSPDTEEENEMVFCDACDVCVHQACYGIAKVPEGSWVCRTCALGIRPHCILCPNQGGAMKSTKSGQKWAHVSCALWIPEVSIGCVEQMEPIVRLSQIPASRWSLVCSLCKERLGACIQCSMKTCRTAYHVTCAFKAGLEARIVLGNGGVDFISYCEKHTSKRDSTPGSGIGLQSNKEKNREVLSEEKADKRAKRIQEVESEFYNYVDTKKLNKNWKVDEHAISFIFNYWKLKRASNFNKPLLTPKQEEMDLVNKLEQNSLQARINMFIYLRQDLEKARNLCYMVNRREKLSRTLIHVKEEIFRKQVSLMSDSNTVFTEKESEVIIKANRGLNIYDKLHSSNADGVSLRNLKTLLEGNKPLNVRDPKSERKSPLQVTRLPNPYAKHYISGLRCNKRFSDLNSSCENTLFRDVNLSIVNKKSKSCFEKNESEMSKKESQVKDASGSSEAFKYFTRKNSSFVSSHSVTPGELSESIVTSAVVKDKKSENLFGKNESEVPKKKTTGEDASGPYGTFRYLTRKSSSFVSSGITPEKYTEHLHEKIVFEGPKQESPAEDASASSKTFKFPKRKNSTFVSLPYESSGKPAEQSVALSSVSEKKSQNFSIKKGSEISKKESVTEDGSSSFNAIKYLRKKNSSSASLSYGTPRKLSKQTVNSSVVSDKISDNFLERKVSEGLNKESIAKDASCFSRTFKYLTRKKSSLESSLCVTSRNLSDQIITESLNTVCKKSSEMASWKPSVNTSQSNQKFEPSARNPRNISESSQCLKSNVKAAGDIYLPTESIQIAKHSSRSNEIAPSSENLQLPGRKQSETRNNSSLIKSEVNCYKLRTTLKPLNNEPDNKHVLCRKILENTSQELKDRHNSATKPKYRVKTRNFSIKEKTDLQSNTPVQRLTRQSQKV